MWSPRTDAQEMMIRTNAHTYYHTADTLQAFRGGFTTTSDICVSSHLRQLLRSETEDQQVLLISTPLPSSYFLVVMTIPTMHTKPTTSNSSYIISDFDMYASENILASKSEETQEGLVVQNKTQSPQSVRGNTLLSHSGTWKGCKW